MKRINYILACLVFILAFALVVVPVSANVNLRTVEQNDVVLLGEKDLDISAAVGGAPYIVFQETDSSPIKTIQLTPSHDVYHFDIIGDDLAYSANKGWWYRSSDGETKGAQAFRVLIPQADIRMMNTVFDSDVTNGAIRRGNDLDIKLEATTLQYIQLRNTGLSFDCDLKVTNPVSIKYENLYTPTGTRTLLNLPIQTNPFFWSSNNGAGSTNNNAWMTEKLDSNLDWFYPAGTYTVQLACAQNQLNFTNTPKTVTIYEDLLVLTISPSTIKRGEKFTTTINGVPNTPYLLWVKDCSGKQTGYECDQPPMIIPCDGCQYMYFERFEGKEIGETLIECYDCPGCMKTVDDTVPDYPDGGSYYYAIVVTDETGTRTVQWQTNSDTKWGTFTICAQPWEPSDVCYYDPYKVKDCKTVTVNHNDFSFETYVYNQVNHSAYLGETVCIRGINKDSKITYLFIKGPCQSCPGNNLVTLEPVVNGDGSTFSYVTVDPQGNWQYIWDTKDLPLDLGQYVIYAASKPNDAQSLDNQACNDCYPIKQACAEWHKVNFTFNKPTIVADINPKALRIECCSPPAIIVTGKATGITNDTTIVKPTQVYSQDDTLWGKPAVISDPVPIAYWIFGEDKVAGEKYIFNTTLVPCGGDFTIDLRKEIDTLQLAPGQYKVVVQHPMYNHRLDIIPETWIYKLSEWYMTWWHLPYLQNEIWYPDTAKKFVVTATPVRWSKLFVIDGPDRLKGMDAYNKLISGFPPDEQNIDDSIVVLSFKVESNNATRADFSGSPVSGTAPLSVQFTDISTGTPSTWLWFFGDGVTSTEKNPQHTYLTQGVYNVSLTVSNSAGSSGTTKLNYITVSGVGPTPTVTQTPIPGANTINLLNGWNFVSTPKTLADGQNTAGVVFGGVDTAGRSIYLYNAGTGVWDAMNASTIVKPLDGIWIYSNGAKQVSLTFKSGGASTPPTKNVYLGWNAIGFSDVTPKSAKATLISVDNSPTKVWAQVMGWNAASQVYDAAIVNVDPYWTEQMQPTKGYWLFMNGNNPPWTLASLSS